MQNSPILSLTAVSKTYHDGHQAIKNISFDLFKGECLGLVGESGCGKSTLARCILTLEKMEQGEILFMSERLHAISGIRLKKVRRQMQMVFQNPTASFNAKLTIKDSLLEPIRYQKRIASFLTGSDEESLAAQLLNKVRLPADFMFRYPAQLSGGQKQLVAVARAISTEPQLIVLDEPTASLDVSIQASTLNLLKDLQQELNLTYLFISHDLSAVNFMSQRIAVMLDGEIIDLFDRDELFADQRHCYTKRLLSIFDAN
jgi:peptide/nickel transport system ATP-binding protein